jgi:hypothetical protein
MWISQDGQQCTSSCLGPAPGRSCGSGRTDISSNRDSALAAFDARTDSLSHVRCVIRLKALFLVAPFTTAFCHGEA